MINELSFSKVKLLINLESCFRRFLNNMTLQSNLDYPDLDYPDFSIIRTFSLVPFFFMNINKL